MSSIKYICLTRRGRNLNSNNPVQAWLSWHRAMSVLYKIFIKDFKIIKFCFFLLTSFFLYGEFRQFLIEKPSLTSDARTNLAPNHFPDVLICKIEGYDKKQLKFHGYETSYQYAIDEFLRYTIKYQLYMQ